MALSFLEPLGFNLAEFQSFLYMLSACTYTATPAVGTVGTVGTVSNSVVFDCSARRRKNFSISVVHSTAEANTMQITHCQTVKLVVPKRRFAKFSHVMRNTSST